MAIVSDGLPFSSWQWSATASHSSSWSSVSGELELLGVSVLSHQWRHPGGFPSLSESDGKERLLMVREKRLLSRRDEGRRPVGDRNAQT
jgi:hypothetical protein